MSEDENNPIERLNREVLIELAKQSVTEAHKHNPNALGFIMHGSWANEGLEGKKQPRENSDLDIITIRQKGDDKATIELGNILWEKIGANYNILVDTGPWGSVELEKVHQTINSQSDKERLRQEWKHLGDTIIVIGANPEVETCIKKALLE